MERLPLSGVRVIALSFYWAGPVNTLVLADLGAEVIKIEHHLARGPYRREPTDLRSPFGYYPDHVQGEKHWNRSGAYNKLIRGKLSCVLDLNHPKGKELFLRLVKISDVVQDNYSRRAMPQFGFDYPVLKEVNPQIIMVRQAGFGTIGPYRDYIAGGCPTGDHGGQTYFHGYYGGPPLRSETCLADPWGGLTAAMAVLAALLQRRRTGRGQYVDISQADPVALAFGDKVVAHQLKATERLPRVGNRHHFMAPHGCYPCRGDDRWIAIAVGSDDEYAALCRVMGNPLWAKEGKFSDQMGRYENQDELDKQIAEWTIKYDHIELMHMLQKEGVAAGAVLDQSELMDDPQLKERNYYVDIEHPETGVRPYPRWPWLMSKTPKREYRRAPLLGEHNRYVFGELLGLSDTEIAELEMEKVIANQPLA